MDELTENQRKQLPDWAIKYIDELIELVNDKTRKINCLHNFAPPIYKCKKCGAYRTAGYVCFKCKDGD